MCHPEELERKADERYQVLEEEQVLPRSGGVRRFWLGWDGGGLGGLGLGSVGQDVGAAARLRRSVSHIWVRVVRMWIGE